MREILILAIHLLVTIAKLLRPGGVRAVAAESLLLPRSVFLFSRLGAVSVAFVSTSGLDTVVCVPSFFSLKAVASIHFPASP